MPEEVRLGTYLLGIHGIALSRRLLDADDTWLDARLGEVREIVDGLDGPLYGASLAIPEHDVASGYARWSETYDAPGNMLIDVEQPVVWSILDALPPGVAVDAAAGTGRHSRHLRDLGHAVLAIDLTPEMLRNADASVRARGDYHRLPVRDAAADVAVCTLALTHVIDPAPVIAELARVVRPGGTVVLSDIHPLAAVVTGQAMFRGADGRFGFVRNHFHQHSAYLDAFAAAGLDLVRCLEPRVPDDVQLGLATRFAPAAAEAAIDGLPFALVWHLRRSAAS